MKSIFIFLLVSIGSAKLFGQHYERNSTCGTDTIHVDYRSIKAGDRNSYKAFKCTQVSKLGIRADLGFNHYVYNAKTSSWLGNHNGALLGLTIAYSNFSFGAKFKPATVRPRSTLVFAGEPLTNEAKLNPIKVDYDLSYSINFKSNVSIEPYVAITTNRFIVINEEQLVKDYDIRNTSGLTVGVGVNKYFRLADFQFISIFARYGYGLSDFKRTNNNLGFGYSDLVVGIAYKGFIKQTFHKRV